MVSISVTQSPGVLYTSNFTLRSCKSLTRSHQWEWAQIGYSDASNIKKTLTGENHRNRMRLFSPSSLFHHSIRSCLTSSPSSHLILHLMLNEFYFTNRLEASASNNRPSLNSLPAERISYFHRAVQAFFRLIGLGEKVGGKGGGLANDSLIHVRKVRLANTWS